MSISLTDIWTLVLLIAPAVVGVVGFLLQTQNLRKSRLEQSKLKLEIERLQRDAAQRDLADSKLRLEVARLEQEARRSGTRVQLVMPNEAAKEISDSVTRSNVLRGLASSGLPAKKRRAPGTPPADEQG